MAELSDNRLARSRRLARRCWWLIVVGVGTSLLGVIALRFLADAFAAPWLGVGGLLWVGLSIVAPLVVLVSLHASVAPQAVARAASLWSMLIVVLWAAMLATWTFDLGRVLAGPYGTLAFLVDELLLFAALVASAVTFLIISRTAAEPKSAPRLLPARACWRLLAAVVLIRAALILPYATEKSRNIAIWFGWINALHWSGSIYELPWGVLSILSTAAYAAELFFIIMLAIRLRAFSQGLIVFRPGLCALCGYDLTGLTEPRCPECGSAAA